MISRMKAAHAVAALILGLSLAACSTPRAPGQALPGPGAPAPDFTLPVGGGGEVTLKEKLAEGPVVLVFYRGHW